MHREILLIATPLLLSAIGGLYAEKAGILNIAQEGFILIGAFATAVITRASGSAAIGTSAAILVSLVLGSLFASVSIGLRANIFVTGLAMNLLASGLTSFVSVLAFGTKGTIRTGEAGALGPVIIPVIGEIPIIGDAVSGHSVFFYVAVFALFAGWWILYRTSFGLRIRVSGADPDTLRARGVDPHRYRFAAILVSSASSALAGASLALDLGAYVPNMSAGRGWIALVAIYLGRRHPFGVAAACLAFAGAEYASYRIQGFIEIPKTLVLAFPYLITLAGMTVFAVLERRKRSPASGRNPR